MANTAPTATQSNLVLIPTIRDFHDVLNTSNLTHTMNTTLDTTVVTPLDTAVDNAMDRALSGILDDLEAAIGVLSIYYTLLLIILGVICNTLAIAVLSRKAFKGTSMALYFRFLSLMDLAAILTGLTRFFQISAFGFDVRNNEDSCRVNFWIMNVFLFSSSYTLIAVTTERVLSIIKPHKVRIICSTKRINHIIAGIFVCMAVINTPIFYLLGTLEDTNPITNMTTVRYCTVVVQRDTIRLLFWWYESVMFAFVPCCILIVFNIIILKGVIDSRRKMKKMTSLATNNVSVKSENADEKKEKQGDQKNKISSLTVTLLSINVTFIICNFPICVFQVTPLFQAEWQVSRISIIMVHFFLMLMYTNNALNFLLYCITGSKFRTELVAMISEAVAKITGGKAVKT